MGLGDGNMTSEDSVVSAFQEPATALVSGASRGIGLALVKQLLADCSVEHVFASARHARTTGSLADLARVHAARLTPVDMDVTDEPSVCAAARLVAARSARLDLVMNCAGLLHDGAGIGPERRLADIDPAHIARSFAVNATGPLLVAKHFAPLFPRRDRVVFASLSARVGSIGDNRLGGWYGYRASKAAQNMFTRNLSVELKRRSRGIVCVALHPGTVDTELSRPFQGRVPADRLFTAERAAQQLLEVVNGLGPQDNGAFFAWDGQPIPW